MSQSLESKLNDIILDRGIPLSVISQRTGIADGTLRNSLRNDRKRKIRGDELLAVCKFLQLDPVALFSTPYG